VAERELVNRKKACKENKYSRKDMHQEARKDNANRTQDKRMQSKERQQKGAAGK
jgi:hypothetical protein